MSTIICEMLPEEMAREIEKVGGYINDHYKDNKLQQDVGAIVMLGNGKLAMWFGGGSCLNEAYISKVDGLPHLSTWSIGGTIYRGPVKPDKESIKEYNDSVISKSFQIVDYSNINF